MSGLVDADKVIAKVDLSYLTLSLLIGQEESKIAVAEIKRLIREIPTVDAEPIIRCKDCKYWNKHHFVDIYVCSIHNKEGQYPYLLFEMDADDFCSRGELKDD